MFITPRQSRDLRRTPRPAAAALATVLLGLSVWTLPGCNILGPALMAVTPDPSVAQQYALDPKRPTVIFIDDRANRLPRRSLRTVMADQAQTLLITEADHKNIIDAKAAFAAAAGERAGEPMTITEIGKASKAEIVIYVTVDAFSLSPDGQTYQPEAALRIKVIDAVADKRLWPTEPEGYKLAVSRVQSAQFKPSTRSEAAKSQIDAAQYVGKAIAQVFYKHRVDESTSTGR